MEPAWVFVPEVMLRESGAVLLTSASPIKSTRVIWLRWPRLVAAVCCALLGFAGILMCRLFRVPYYRVVLVKVATEPL